MTIPASITGANRAAAEAGIAAFKGAMTVFDQSLMAPTAKNWEPAIRKYTGDPAAQDQLDLIDTFKAQAIHQIGSVTYTAQVTKANDANVEIHACIDVAHADVIDATGHSATKPGSILRFVRNYSIGSYPQLHGAWLLNQTISITPAQPC